MSVALSESSGSDLSCRQLVTLWLPKKSSDVLIVIQRKQSPRWPDAQYHDSTSAAYPTVGRSVGLPVISMLGSWKVSM